MELIRKYNDLKQEVYRFWLKDLDYFYLVLDSYWLEERKNKRCKFKVIRQYNRIDDRNNTIKLEEIVFDDEIKRLAKLKFFDSVRVVANYNKA